MNKRMFQSILTMVALGAAGCAAQTSDPSGVGTSAASEAPAAGSNEAKVQAQPKAEDLRSAEKASIELKVVDLPSVKNESLHVIPEDAPNKPVIYNAGIGCDTKDCLWIEASWLGNIPDIAIFDPTNWAPLGDYSNLGTNLWQQQFPGFVNYTLRLNEAQVIKLYTTGLEVFAVDWAQGAWSQPFLIRGH